MSILFWIIWSVATTSLAAALLLIGSELLMESGAELHGVYYERVINFSLLVLAIGAALVTLAHFIIGILYIAGVVSG